MKIAHLLPYGASFPLKKHNGRYEWALRLGRLQAAQGHQVTIYAGPGSNDVSSQIEWKSLASDLGSKSANNKALMSSALQDNQYDIYHSHFDSLHYDLAFLTNKPVVYTQHWFPTEQIAAAAQACRSNNVFTVPPTHFMAEEDKKLGIPVAQVIHHGIDLDIFKPAKNPTSERLVFVGRITRSKGVLEAVKIAHAANMPLDIIGKINDADQAYWQEIAPLVDGTQIAYLGAKPLEEVAAYFAQAKAFIFPSKSNEAFGLVTIEAQACGIPVVISNVGASTELVDNKKSGFIATNEAEFLTALTQLSTIDRNYCRKFAEKFSIQDMSHSYEQFYKKLVSTI